MGNTTKITSNHPESIAQRFPKVEFVSEWEGLQNKLLDASEAGVGKLASSMAAM